MRIYTVEGPDGRIYEVEGPEGATNAQVVAAIRRQLAAQPAPATPKESTILGEVARGAKQLVSTSRTGIGALVSPEEAARAGVERGQQIAAEAGEGPSFAALRKVYEERGLLPAAGALVSQIPRALAGQVPQLAAMAGGAKLGAMAGTAVAPGVGTIAGGVLGAGATLLPQFFGANIERQAAEQLERGEPVKIDRGTAAAAAAGQAAIESAGTALVLGKRVVKGVLGIADDAGLATAKARADLVKAAERSRLGAAGRGAAVGLAEMPIEVAQAVIERAQAGLDVLSPEAFSEYGENAYLAGLVGPTIGAATRVTEPGAARKKLAAEAQAKAAEERRTALTAEEAKKSQPDYILGVADQYEALNKQKSDLMAQIIKGTKEAPLSQEDKDRNVLIQQQLKELEPQLKEQRKEYLSLGGPDAVEKVRAQYLQLEQPPGRVTEPPAEEPAPEAPEEARPRYEQEVRGLNDLLTQQRTAMSEAQSPEEAIAAAEQAQRTKAALDKAQDELAKLPQVPQFEAVQAEVQKLETQFAKAKEAGDQDEVLKLGPQLLEARQQLQQAQPTVEVDMFAAETPKLFTPETVAQSAQLQMEEQQRRDMLGEAMGAGREAATRPPQVAELLARAPEEARRAQVAEQMQAEGRIEREAMTGTAQDLASSMRARELEALRGAPQLTLFPEARETITRTTTEENRVAGLRNELAQQTKILDRLMARPPAPEGLPAQATEGPYSILEMPKMQQAQIAAVERRIEDLKGQIAKAPTVRPGRTERVEGVPELAAPEVELRRPPLIQRINVMAEQALASPRVDEQTKALVMQVQDRLPQLQALISERPQAALAEKAASPLVSENMRMRLERKERQAAAGLRTAPQEIAAWLYRTNQGQAAPEATARVQELLRAVEAPPSGRVSEAPLIGSTVRRAAPAAPAAPAAETQAEREARDAEKRREEQARLERQEAMPATRIEFERAETDNQETRKLMEAMRDAPTTEERTAARKALEDYLQTFVARKEADLKDMQRKAAKNVQDLNIQRKAVTELTTRLEGDLTPKRRASAEKQLAEAQRKLAEHQRRYTLNTREMKIKRTDVQAQRQERNRLLAEANRSRVAGERLGVTEGTQQRALSPVTGAKTIPPKKMFTGSEESKAGATTTDTRQKLTEARGEKQRDVAMSKKEQAEANRIAAELAKKTPEQKAQEQKEEEAVQKEQAKLQGKPAKVTPLRSEKATRRKGEVISELESVEDDFEPELLGGPEEDVFFREAGPEYESRDSTALNASTTEAVKDGDIRTALADLSKNGSTEFVRTLAKRLGDMTMRTKLEVRDQLAKDGKQIEGLYVASKNLVQLHRDALSEEVLTHELTHAATMRVLEADPKTLTPEQRAARQEIENLHATIEKQPDFAKEYGRKDVKEFVSELMSNRDFRNKLDAQKPNFIKRIYNAFMRLIGFPRATMSEKAVENAYKLFMPAQALKAAPAPSARRGAPGMTTANRVADNLIGKEKGVVQNLKDNFLGMGFRAQFVDKLAPLEEALKKGGIDQTKALQAMYYLRMYDQRMHFTSQAIADGVPEIVEKARKDGGTERLIETKPGANISQVVDILKKKDVVKAAGSADAANRLFTLYLAAIRAEGVGIDALNFGGKVTQADLNAARAEIEANPTLKNAFDEARDIYNQYNRNLIEFAVQTGALAKSEAKTLLASNDYVPYYRMRDGVAQLIVGNETPIRIGNLKDSPHLKELVGGDEAIFDFLTSSVQNTAMLLDMSMKNLATKNTMFELRDVGLATVSKVPKSGKTPEGAVTFKRDGEDYFAVVDTDKIGIDSDLLVKGLAGIPTMFPSFVRLLGIPARFLRRVVVASPVYMARQLFRDSLAAAMTSGANIVPVLDSLKQIGKPKALQNRGITGGQVFTGMPEDVTRMLKDMQAGKVSVTSGLAWLEAKSAQADALTREAQYQSYLKQGLSEMEATYMALESMNFSKRGLSPTLHMVSTLIPFFNAQIQGLDVLYRAFTKQMPMNERLAIRDKLWTRGMLMAGMSMAYALAMQDDETYKNAKPEEKYGNWFVPVPGFDQMVRLPIPFELGYIFKALPEAIVNTLANEEGGAEALKAGKHILQQMIPGASSYFLPQAIKPALEAFIGTSLYTGRDIESAREQMMEPGLRYRDNTTELAREVGELTGFSPIKMEFLIRGYTGSMGMALLQALSAPFGSSGPEGATKRLSDLPVVGTLFQPNDASGIIDATYERMKRVNQVKETYEGLLDKGRTADAQKYLADRTEEMALASVAGSFREYMGQITEFERNIRASNMTPDQKREKLDQARQMKIKLAESVRAVADRKTPQASPA